MKYTFDGKLVVAFSSRAVLDMEAEHAVFAQQGEAAYMKLQRQRLKKPAKPGVALPLLAKLMALNEGRDDDHRVVECVLISQNDYVSGMRAFNSLAYYGIHGVGCGSFTRGADPLRYLKAYQASLFLSADEAMVRRALDQGIAAARIFARTGHLPDPADKTIRLAYDFDGVLASDQSERVTHEQGIPAFIAHENKNMHMPMPPGPFRPVLEAFHKLAREGHPIHNAIFTARPWPSNQRLISTLDRWGLDIGEAHFTGSEPKAGFLERFAPDMYFDDTPKHVNGAHPRVPTGHVVAGVKNE